MLIGNIYIQLASTIKDANEFGGDDLKHYYKDEQAYIKALNDTYNEGDRVIRREMEFGRQPNNLRVRKNQPQTRCTTHEVKRPIESTPFYTMPCRFVNMRGEDYDSPSFLKDMEKSRSNPFILIFSYDDGKKVGVDFTSELRYWQKEHEELRKHIPNDAEAMQFEPKRLLLFKWKDENNGEEYSFKVQDAIMSRALAQNTYAIIIFNAEIKKF